MKKINQKPGNEKSLDVILSRISENNILTIDEMIRVRGGEGDDPIIVPPIPPSKQQ